MSDDQSIGVIYVEDDDDVRIGGVQALELAGFTVSGFTSVEAADGAVRSDMPSVVVCDVRLRGKSGLDWLSDLRRLDQNLPVILITGPRRYFDGCAGNANRCLRLYRETLLLGATHFGRAQSGRKETADPGGALVEVCPGGPPGN